MWPFPRSDLRPAAIAAAITFILAAHLIGRVGSFCSPVRADSYAYSCIGYKIAQGGRFYSPELSDVKPPALYHLYAIGYAFLPAGREAMIPFDSLIGLLGYWAVYLLARDLYGRGVGLILAVVAAFAQNALNVWDFGTEAFGLAESFMILPAAMAVRHYRRGLRESATTPLLWCGLWLGIEASFKQTALPLFLTVAVHWVGLAILRRIGWRRFLGAAAAMIAGVVIALAPWAVYLMACGTWWRMLDVLGPGALSQLNKSTARPDQWSNVLPLWVAMAWAAIGLFWWIEAQGRKESARIDPRWPTHSVDVAFLLIWLALEYVMLIVLPVRSFHYYVVSSLPLILLAGTFWSAIMTTANRLPGTAALASLSVAAFASIALARTAIDRIVPMAIARYQSYDAQADRAFFDNMVAREVINSGLPPDSELR